MDYDEFAPTYAWARHAVPWVVEPLVRAATTLPSGAMVLDIGCGTGNYVRALATARADLVYLAIDLSRPMLRQAAGGRVGALLVAGDCSRALPIRSRRCSLAYAVDVIHHIADPSTFFSEVRRVLQPDGQLLVVTDSEQSFRERSLTHFFPEVLAIELARYPALPALHLCAEAAGLQLVGEERAEGNSPLDDEFVRSLEAKCSSAIRLLAPAEHSAGMARVRSAQERGELWHSCYVVLRYTVAMARATA
jgi:ubiquinone/menaquinone biosynthesis C-methylase UbiE